MSLASTCRTRSSRTRGRRCRSCGSTTAPEATTTRSTAASSWCRRPSSIAAAVAICQTGGGTLYSHPTAVALQVAGLCLHGGDFHDPERTSCAATSGGGALAIETYARGAHPARSRACTTSTRATTSARTTTAAATPGLDRRGVRRRPRRDRRREPRASPGQRVGGIAHADRRVAAQRDRPDRAARSTGWRCSPSRSRSPPRRHDARSHQRAQHAWLRSSGLHRVHGAMGRQRARRWRRSHTAFRRRSSPPPTARC